MFIDKMNYSPRVLSYLTLHVIKNGKCMYDTNKKHLRLNIDKFIAVKSLSPTDKPLEWQKKLTTGKNFKWNDQQKKNYFMFQLNEDGAKRMSLVMRKRRRQHKL